MKSRMREIRMYGLTRESLVGNVEAMGLYFIAN